MKGEAIMRRWFLLLVSLVLFSQVACTLALYLALTRDMQGVVRPVVMAAMDAAWLKGQGKLGLPDYVHRANQPAP